MDVLIPLAALLGTLLVAGLALALLRRANRADGERAMQAVIDRVYAAAGDKLDDHLSSGSRQLELLAHSLRQQFEAIQAETQRSSDLRAAAVREQLAALSSEAAQAQVHREQSMEQQFSVMKGELHRVSELVADMQSERARQHGEVVATLEEAAKAQAALADTAQGLREALANPKARGNWGERTAEDVLRLAGFVEGVSYHRRRQLPCGTVPDFTFELPHGRCVHMDVKFPADNYLRSLEASTEEAADRFRMQFLRDVKSRIAELGDRSYIDRQSTVDYLLLFIPNESIYSFIHESDAGMVDHALGQRVVLCSPSTLFAVLAVVRQSVENFRLERTSDEILACLARFAEQWEKYSEHVDRLGKQLSTVARTYDQLAGTRRSLLCRELDRIDDLRARCHDDGPETPSGEAGLVVLDERLTG
ncbi:MAG: hypothetical protein JJLCMIEE_00852 [Acidimicrobiales bacterium]|nr:MAG: DNA recombination protein RmuC [Actinomycetota bacterium]MBV6507794.1 hypothetical protein [Acidimicrobiales bacterium]RIK05952.1 MAG: hypothetical protein DCC48_08310 [Acidobacteriota bacterium]